MKRISVLINGLFTKAKSLVMEELNPDVTNNQPIPEHVPGELSEVTQHSPVKKITWLRGITAVFNGIGIGLLLGILLSLSLSPVVSGVIAALSGLLAVLLGLDEKYLDPLKSLRIGAFGLFAVAGILLGLYIRANDLFTPSLLDKKNEYVSIGYSEEEARAFITKSIEADTGKTRREASQLYSSTVDAGACDVLVYANEGASVKEIVNTFTEAGGTWKELAENFDKELPEPIVGISLLAMRDCFCNLASSGEIKMTNPDQVRRLNKRDPLERIEQELSYSGKNWNAIVEKVREKIPEQYRKDLYLLIINVLTHE
jgi:hypothetical protein